MDHQRTLIDEIVAEAQSKGLTQKALAAGSHVTEETLSRMKKRGTGNLGAVTRLANAVGLRVGLIGRRATARNYKPSFRDQYGVGLAWSNKAVTDELLIRRALVAPRFQILLDAALEFGLDVVTAEWQRLINAGEPDALRVQVTTDRILGHLHDGYRQATA